jgi:hypothetical protein
MPTTVARSSSFILARRVTVSGDAWEGDAEVTVEVNGVISEDGAARFTTEAALPSDGTDTLAVGGTTPPASAPSDALTYNLSEDVWESDEDFVVRINGAAVETPRMATTPAKCRRNPKLHLHD